MSDHIPGLDSDTVSTWIVYLMSDGWHAFSCDPVPDTELDVLYDGDAGGEVVTEGRVIADTRSNAMTKAAMLAKRQGVGG